MCNDNNNNEWAEPNSLNGEGSWCEEDEKMIGETSELMKEQQKAKEQEEE